MNQFQTKQTANSRAIPWIVAAALLSMICCCGALLALWVGEEAGAEGLLVGLILAFIPVPFYVLLVLWIDRFEPEPAWMLVIAFIWGAVISTAFAAIVNSTGGLMVSMLAGMEVGDFFTSVISAPIVEETIKGLAVLIFFLWRKDEFDNIIDGIIYAALIGLGFAMTENVIYYGRAFAAEGITGSTGLFLLRGLAVPFLHPLCTALTGIGLGVARQRNKSAIRYFSPIVGLLLAISLHALWNLSATLGGWLIAYIAVLIPTLVAVFILVLVVQNKEGRIIRTYLSKELQNGIISQLELDCLSNLKSRFLNQIKILFNQGLTSWQKSNLFYQIGGELAFHRWRIERGVIPDDLAAREKESWYLSQLRRQ